jgi:hypothetical protein
MTANAIQLVAACLIMVLLTFGVGLRMFLSRVREMREKRIHPQAVSTSAQMAARMVDTRAADNFRNLFEVPILFYTLVAIALATNNTSGWLVLGCWVYVALRAMHSLIQCTYNKVMHRLAAFMTSFLLLVGLWVAFFMTISSSTS